jgi:hypothetical protein
MLVEQKIVRQVAGERARRLFSDDDFDLILWNDADGSFAGFQLCYDKGHDERALTWKNGEGYTHDRVDAGEVVGKAKTPILVADGIFPAHEISDRFSAASAAIDQNIAHFIREKILLYRP